MESKILGVVFSICFLSVFILASAGVTENLIKEGSFEQYPLSGWRTSGKGEVSLDTDIKHEGNSSLKISLIEVGGINLISPSFNVSGSKLYLVSMWYKDKGLSDKYEGASICCRIYFQDISGKTLVALPSGMRHRADWSIFTIIIEAPKQASSAYLSVGINSKNKELLPILWLDSLQIKEYSPPVPSSEAKTYTYYAINLHAGKERSIEDKDAKIGKAVLLKKGIDKKGVCIFGPYTTEQPPGQYKAIYRLKVSDNTKNIPVANIDVTNSGFGNYIISSREIKATDFKNPNEYQEFVLEFIKAPSGWLEFRTRWTGEGEDLWIDNVKVIEEKVFDSDEEILKFWK